MTLKEQEVQSINKFFESQDMKLELINEFVKEGYEVDEKLLETLQIFQDRGLEVYERYMKAQRNLANKIQNLNVIETNVDL